MTFLAACSVNQDVISERKIQKRKYLKGFHISKKERKEKPIIRLNKIDNRKDEPHTPISEPAKQRNTNVSSSCKIEILEKKNDLKTIEKTTHGLDEKSAVVEPIYEGDFSSIIEEPKVNIPAYISLGGAVLLLIDVVFLFTGIISLIGFFLALIFGFLALTPKFREREGTIIAKVLLVIIYISFGILLTLLVLFFSAQVEVVGIPTAVIIIAVLFLIGLFLMI